MPLTFQGKITRTDDLVMIRIPKEMFDLAEIEGGADIYSVHDADTDDVCLMSRSKRAVKIEAIEQNRVAEDAAKVKGGD